MENAFLSKNKDEKFASWNWFWKISKWNPNEWEPAEAISKATQTKRLEIHNFPHISCVT